jgi:hypothetical protein
LARFLSGQGQLGDETRGLYERSLAIYIRNDGPNTATENYNQLAGEQSAQS